MDDKAFLQLKNQYNTDIAFLREAIDDLNGNLLTVGRTVKNVLNTQINAPAYPSSNLLWNGELGHSVNSWFDSSYGATDKAFECAHFFSHDGTLSGLALDPTDARTSSTNKTLKATGHSTYSSAYGKWNSENGWGEIQGIKTIDVLLPSNMIDATTPLARVSMIAAKRNAYIELTEACLMFAGIYDNTSGQRKFLSGDLGFTATLNGTPAASTIERRYKIFAQSDRGFTLLSSEVTIAAAPADGLFTSTKNISMSWKQQAGQLQVSIYEYIPSLAEYRLIKQVSSGTSYIHDGTFLTVVAGYPSSPTGTTREASFYTKTGEMTLLATNGVSLKWDTINFPIAVPNDYDKSLTTDRQWLRIGLTVAPNLLIPGVTSDGSTTITAPANVFDAEYAADFVGKTVYVYDSNETLLYTTTVSSRTNDTQIVLGTAIAAGTARIVRIVAAGFHGIVVDKVHLGYQQNTSYAPNANDFRTLQPVAAPTSSDQGGVGDGGSGGGVETGCVIGRTLIKQGDGSWQPIDKAIEGDLWASGEFKPNLVTKLKMSFQPVRRVRAANGCEVVCTDTERFVRDRSDHNGTDLFRLRIGDEVLTEINGKIETSKLLEISAFLPKKEFVFTPTLSQNRLFIAGEIKAKYSWWEFFKFMLWGKRKVGGFVLHNRKYNEEFYGF